MLEESSLLPNKLIVALTYLGCLIPDFMGFDACHPALMMKFGNLLLL